MLRDAQNQNNAFKIPDEDDFNQMIEECGGNPDEVV